MQKTLENLALEEIDQSNAVLFIHYDPDTKMIYLAGKVRYITVNRGQVGMFSLLTICFMFPSLKVKNGVSLS